MRLLCGCIALALFLGMAQTAATQGEKTTPPFADHLAQVENNNPGSKIQSISSLLPDKDGRGIHFQLPFMGEISTRGLPFMGSEEAKVTLIEFSDYQCFFCRRHDQKVAPRLVEEYVETGQVKYFFADFPLASHPGGSKASKAAQTAHCAGDQGKYWEMNDLLFRSPASLTKKTLIAFGISLELDNQAFLDCIESGKHTPKVQDGLTQGKRAGVRGTPTFFFGLTNKTQPKIRVRRTLTGAHPYPAFKQLIEELLAQ